MATTLLCLQFALLSNPVDVDSAVTLTLPSYIPACYASDTYDMHCCACCMFSMVLVVGCKALKTRAVCLTRRRFAVAVTNSVTWPMCHLGQVQT
jgi:hypothetical protein